MIPYDEQRRDTSKNLDYIQSSAAIRHAVNSPKNNLIQRTGIFLREKANTDILSKFPVESQSLAGLIGAHGSSVRNHMLATVVSTRNDLVFAALMKGR